MSELSDFVARRLRALASDIESGAFYVAEYTDAAWGVRVVVGQRPPEDTALPVDKPHAVQTVNVTASPVEAPSARRCAAGTPGCQGGHGDVREVRVGQHNRERRCVKCNEEVPHGGPAVG